MSGSFTYDPQDQPLTADAPPVYVLRYNPRDANPYQILPNIRCSSIQTKEGSEVSAARFEYIMDDTVAESRFPNDFAEIWPIRASGRYVVRNEDRLVVMTVTPSGQYRVLFDGFASIPQFDITEGSSSVTFVGSAVTTRLWDTPIITRRQKHGDKFGDEVALEDTKLVPLPCRFNPDAKGNAGAKVLTNADRKDAKYPVFQEQVDDADSVKFWTLYSAVAYLLVEHNDEAYVDNPDLGVLEKLIKNRRPRDGSDTFDSRDKSTYDEDDIIVRDFDASNMAWPDAVSRLLSFHGFGFRFVLEEDEKGKPWNYIEIYRKDGDGPTDPKELNLPKARTTLNPAEANVFAIHIARDQNAIANEVIVETRPKRYEISVILSPGFPIYEADAALPGRKDYIKANLDLDNATAYKRSKYRLFIADECGESHWDWGLNGMLTKRSLDLSDVLGKEYVRRYRPGRSALLSKDHEGKYLRSQLAFSRDYDGASSERSPKLWDGTGTWQPIKAGWELLKDRLGIMVTVDDPEAWKIGKFSKAGKQQSGDVLRTITSLAKPANKNTRFYLRLTTVIEDDFPIQATAPKRVSSPSRFSYTKRIDARDHFKYEKVHSSSPFYNKDTATATDDTLKAKAHANQMRAAHEMPPHAGTVVIPLLVNYYRIGDRISRINGREMSFLTNVGEDQRESPSYPYVVGVEWSFPSNRYSTTLYLSDRRGEVQRA
jgi:hypothetical protein